MKRKAVGLLLAIVMCVGMFAGCGGAGGAQPSPKTTFIEGFGTVRDYYDQIPITDTIDGHEVTIQEYAVVNQKVEEGYKNYLYAFFDFKEDVDPEGLYKKIVLFGGCGEWYGSIIGMDEDRKLKLLDGNTHRVIYHTSLIWSYPDFETSDKAIPEGTEVQLEVGNQTLDVPEEDWSTFRFVENIPEERIIEAEADGTITKAGGKISRELKEYIEKDLKEAE